MLKNQLTKVLMFAYTQKITKYNLYEYFVVIKILFYKLIFI